MGPRYMRFWLSSVGGQLDPVCCDVGESVDESLSAIVSTSESFDESLSAIKEQ